MLDLIFAAALQTQPVFQEGSWTVTSTPDPITDHQEVTATLRSPQGRLAFMCSRGERSVLAIQPTQFLGGPLSRYELRDTWIRLDDGAAQMASWKYFDDYATPYSTPDGEELLARMGSAARMVVRLSAYDRSTVDLTFDLTGTQAAISAARVRC